MTKKVYSKRHPIDPVTAKITMIFLGTLLVALSFVLNDIVIALHKVSITHYILGVTLIVSAIIGFVELGLKRWTDWSKLRSFENQQLLSFTISFIVLLSGLMNLFSVGTIFGIDILSFWNGGAVFFSGAIIILEAIR